MFQCFSTLFPVPSLLTTERHLSLAALLRHSPHAGHVANAQALRKRELDRPKPPEHSSYPYRAIIIVFIPLLHHCHRDLNRARSSPPHHRSPIHLATLLASPMRIF
jgi:hypothetical protein